MSWFKPRRCAHMRLRGIYGDEIIFGTPNFSRLQCVDCAKFLDGPVAWAGDHTNQEIS